VPTHYSLAEAFQRGLVGSPEPKPQHKVSWTLRLYPAFDEQALLLLAQEEQEAQAHNPPLTEEGQAHKIQATLIGLCAVLQYENDTTNEIVERHEFVQASKPALVFAMTQWMEQMPMGRKRFELLAFLVKEFKLRIALE
jgi:hypothetical protein